MLPDQEIFESNGTKWDSEGIWVYAENPDLSSDFFVACGVILLIFFVLGTSSNGAVLLAFWRNPDVSLAATISL